ncbi:MAG: MmcQ/YjbR family DNA-binding protein [Clostridiales bacterium]|nr:MmcQ/YjbR family DNA-binding protein [Clostridiales bacterium]
MNCGALRDDIYEYAGRNYGSSPEHLWTNFPLYSVFRRADNKKWYAIIMNIQRSKLGLDGDEYVDVLDVKCSPADMEELLGKGGFLPAYHMNRKNWITVLLDGSVDKSAVFELLDKSYTIAKGKTKAPTRQRPTSILVPANPKYYDIKKAFEENDVILWKQSNTIIPGDTVYLYVAAPYSCIRYKCVAVEVDIPYDYTDENVSMNKVMKLKRLYTYDTAQFGLDRLKKHGVVSVRGPRKVPVGLRKELEAESDDGVKE